MSVPEARPMGSKSAQGMTPYRYRRSASGSRPDWPASGNSYLAGLVAALDPDAGRQPKSGPAHRRLWSRPAFSLKPNIARPVASRCNVACATAVSSFQARFGPYRDFGGKRPCLRDSAGATAQARVGTPNSRFPARAAAAAAGKWRSSSAPGVATKTKERPEHPGCTRSRRLLVHLAEPCLHAAGSGSLDQARHQALTRMSPSRRAIPRATPGTGKAWCRAWRGGTGRAVVPLRGQWDARSGSRASP